MKFFFLLIIFSILPSFLICQTKIAGKVTDSEKHPLPGANVFVKDSYDGISTKEDGSFSFTTTEEGDATLVVSFIGYKSTEKNIRLIGKEINIDIVLEEEAKELGTVVISAGSFEASDEKKAVILKPLDIVTTGSDADIYSALETLPGTQQIGETEGLFVRGGSASETVTIIDEMIVQKPFYTSVPDIPARGRFSPMLFKGIVFSTGGYSAQYGQALSSALILKSQDLAEDTRTAINLMVLGLGGSHTQKWENSSLAFEGGYYNLGPYFKVQKQRQEWDTAPVGIEGSANFRQKTSATGIFKAFASYNYSNFSLYTKNLNTLSLKDYTKIKSNNYYINLSHKDIFGDDWTIFTGASFSLDKDMINLNSDKIDQDENLNQGRVTITKQVLNNSFITFGGEFQNLVYTSSFNEFESRLNEVFFAGYLESDIYLTNDIAARIGVREEHSKAIGKYNLAPRISLAYRLWKYDQLNFAYGKFYQTPYKDFLVQPKTSGFTNKDFKFENATHYILNYQYIGTGRTFRIELYYKDYDNLTKGDLYTYPYSNFHNVPYSNDGGGYAKGIDIFWRDSETLPLTDYWISYSYLDTKRDFANYPGLANPTFATPHTFSVVLKHWVQQITTYFGLTYSFATGRPYYNPNNQEFLGDKTKSYNNLSLNCSYITNVFNNFTVVFFSIDNIIGFNNVYGYNYSTDGAIREAVLPTSKRSVFLGMFISLGEQSPY